MKKLIILFVSIFGLVFTTFATAATITINLDSVPTDLECGTECLCDQNWVVSDVVLSVTSTTTSDGCSVNDCSWEHGYNSFPPLYDNGILLKPGRLILDLSETDNITQIRVDLEDYCSTGCSSAAIYDGSTRIARKTSQSDNGPYNSAGWFIFDQSIIGNNTIDKFIVTSCDGHIGKITITTTTTSTTSSTCISTGCGTITYTTCGGWNCGTTYSTCGMGCGTTYSTCGMGCGTTYSTCGIGCGTTYSTCGMGCGTTYSTCGIGCGTTYSTCGWSCGTTYSTCGGGWGCGTTLSTCGSWGCGTTYSTCGISCGSTFNTCGIFCGGTYSTCGIVCGTTFSTCGLGCGYTSSWCQYPTLYGAGTYSRYKKSDTPGATPAF